MFSNTLGRQENNENTLPEKSDFWHLSSGLPENYEFMNAPTREPQERDAQEVQSKKKKVAIINKSISKKKNVPRSKRKNNSNVQIIRINKITENSGKKDSKRCRYKVQFQYKVGENGKEQTATQNFGRAKFRGKWYTECGDPLIKKQTSSRINDIENPFQPGYWESWLLLNKKTLQESRHDMEQHLNFQY